MNKKFLSAILFGALMATSAGTFVSCKDYDDDIKDLQTQIDTNKTAIAELQKLVGAGKWVTNVAASGENLVVTMSDGSSVTVAGIKGADGKNAAEWTISEDGYWCKDGEKTANLAVAQNGKDGENGVTAPSPSISADGMWVVYAWDEAKGEFVATETEIPAAGTSTYVVEADGVYTLHVADANGEYQEVVLPGTCDSFVVTAPAPEVVVEVEHAVWGKANRDSKEYAALLKAFPEIADHKTNDKMLQGGELPVLINPMELELDDKYTFQLVDVKGKVADVELANPTKGIAADWTVKWGTMSRSAEAEGGLWTLEVTPNFDRKEGYGNVKHASLIATNAKGVSSRTSFAYFVGIKDAKNGEVVVSGDDTVAEYVDGIDVLAKENGADKKSAIFTLTNEYYGKYILEATNPVQVEKYGLTTEGSKLYIAEMPANETSITVTLKLTALGLDGSTGSKSLKLTVNQTISASEGLTPKTVTLNKKAQEVRWDIEELGLSAVEMDQFLKTATVNNAVKFVVTREADKYYVEGNTTTKGQDGETESYVAFNDNVKFYNAKGKVVTYAGDGVWKTSDNKESEVAAFGFDVLATAAKPSAIDGHTAEMWAADTYKVSLTSTTNSGKTVIYSAETELTVENPEIDATYVKLVPAFVENGVYQITGLVSGNYVTYGIDNALITNNGADAIKYIDLDYAEYVENGGDDEEDYGYYNWIPTAAAENASLTVNTWTYEPEDLTESTWIKALNNQLYETRNIRAMISLFGNTENVVPFDFQIVVKSELYSEDASSVTVDATKLKGTFTDTDASKTVDTREIDLSKAFTAKVVAGDEAGKAYELFATSSTSSNDYSTKYNYSRYETVGNYVVKRKTTDEKIKFAAGDAMKLQALTSSDNVDFTDTENNVYYLTINGWNAILKGISDYVDVYGDAIYNTGKKAIEDTDPVEYEDTITTVKWHKFETKLDGTIAFVNNANGTPVMVSGKVFKKNYEGTTPAVLGNSGDEGMTLEEAKDLAALTEMQGTAATYYGLFSNYKDSVKCASATSQTGTTTTPGTPRDTRIASVKFEFDDAEEAGKYFTNTIATDATAENTVLTVNEAADVDVVGGKVVVGMKLVITDVWGMTMKVPFNVEISTK